MPGKSDVYVLSFRRNGEFADGLADTADYENVELQSKEEYFEEEEENPFIGMGKEELLKYSTKPCWRRFRAACMALVLLAWLALLVAVVAIVFKYPKCSNPDARSWWQKEVLYRIYVPSFRDSNGDGIGDLKGIQSELDYIKYLGAGAISLSPIYRTDDSGTDFGILDHQDVHPAYGTLADLEDLVKAAHDKGIHIILDFIPNHTSKNHTWFSQSVQSGDLYRNYYVWRDTKTNWRSTYGGEAWSYDATRNQYFLHQMRNDQPDLNLRSRVVQNELESVIKFWMSKNVDGFYIRHAPYLFEDYDMRDEPMLPGKTGNTYSDYDHQYTFNLPEVHDVMSRWRMLVENSTMEKVLLAGIHSTDMRDVMSYYGAFQRDGAHLSLNRQFFSQRDKCDGACMKSYVHSWMANMHEGRWPNWVGGDENTDRLATRFDKPFVRAFYVITMLLPGTPVIYYGDEISLLNVAAMLPGYPLGSMQQQMRTIMQWTDGYNAGFNRNDTCNGTCETWLGVNSDYKPNNVQVLRADKQSLLNLIRNLTIFRQKTTFLVGDYHQALTDDSVFSFVREFNGEKGYLVAANFGQSEVTRNFASSYNGIEASASVEMVIGPSTANNLDDEVSTAEITLKPHEVVVVSWSYVAKEEF